MFTRITSYFIIASLLISDAARCGNAGFGARDAEEQRHSIPTRQTEHTPLRYENSRSLSNYSDIIAPGTLLINDQEPQQGNIIIDFREGIHEPEDSSVSSSINNNSSSSSGSPTKSSDFHKNDEDIPDLTVVDF